MQQGSPTINEALLSAAERGAGEFVFHLDEGEASLGAAEIAERAEAEARRLAGLGVGPGDAVGVLGPNRPEWVVSAFAVWLAGATLVPIQIPLRVRDPDAFRDQLRHLAEAGGCRVVLCDPGLLGLLPEGTGVGWEGGDAPARARGGGRGSTELPRVGPADPAVIQFSSGSTAAPKGARLTHGAVMAQMEILREGVDRDGERRSILSWTPFFHDLGLFYTIVQVVAWGLRSHHLPTERFARDPAEWLRLIESTRVTSTVAPSSAFGSAVRAARRAGERVDLSGLEAAYFAAEGVDPEVIRAMIAIARNFGFREEALGSTYGLAEAVMAVSYPAVGSGMRMERLSLERLTQEGAAVLADDGPSRLVVSSGPPRMGLRIVGGDGAVLAERQIGEIQVRGRSLMSGYVGTDAPDPFVDGGWLRSGDLGYLADGDLYVTGRIKDMMISMGHNYYPEDFEWAAARVEGVRAGRCVAFGLPDGDVAVLVEAEDGAVVAGFEDEVADAIADTVGIRPREVVVLPPGTVEKTTSGKLRRSAMRDAYAGGALTGVGAS